MVHKRDVEAEDLERRDWTSVFKLGLPTGKVALKAAGKSAGKSGGSNFFNVFSKIGPSFASLKVQKPQAKKFAAAAKPVVKSTPKPVKSTPKPIAKSAPKPSPHAKGWRSIVAKAAEKAKNARQSAKAKLVVKDEAHEQAKQFIQQSIASPGFKPEEFGLEAKHYSRDGREIKY